MSEEAEINAPPEPPVVISPVAEESERETEAPNTSPDTREDHGTSRAERGFRGFQKRIDRMTREKYEAQKEIKHWRESYERQLMASTVVPLSDEQPADVWVKVRNAQVQSGLSQEALNYATPEVKREAERMAQEDADQQKENAPPHETDAEHEAAYQERSIPFAASHSDFNQVVDRIRMSPDVGGEIQDALLEDERGPELAYHLGQNPQLCAELSAMTPEKALAKLEGIAAEIPRTMPLPRRIHRH